MHTHYFPAAQVVFVCGVYIIYSFIAGSLWQMYLCIRSKCNPVFIGLFPVCSVLIGLWLCRLCLCAEYTRFTHSRKP